MFTNRLTRHYRAATMLLAISAALLVALFAAACGNSDDDASTPAATATTAKPTTSGNGGGNGGNGTASSGPVTIVMKDNVFEPAKFTVPVNTAVQVTVENKGAVVHNMHVQSKDKEGKDFTSEMLVNPGASSTFEVKFTKPGTYHFVCDFHLPAMAGDITVE